MLGVYILILFAGLGVVAWLFLTEGQQKNSAGEKGDASDLLSRLGMSGLEKTPPAAAADENNTALGLSLSDTETEELHKQAIAEIEQEESVAVIRDPELLEKCDKLEALITEKNQELEKKDKALAAELSAKKEFNKIKDILEKELKETRDRAHKTQLEVKAAQAESEGCKKRIEQLEEKIKNKDDTIKQKEKEAGELAKKLLATAQKPAQQATPKPAEMPPAEPAQQPPEPPASTVQPKPPQQPEHEPTAQSEQKEGAGQIPEQKPPQQGQGKEHEKQPDPQASQATTAPQESAPQQLSGEPSAKEPNAKVPQKPTPQEPSKQDQKPPQATSKFAQGQVIRQPPKVKV